ncbi:hypothetical protein V7139_27440 [Neobacillus drentensis]
MEGTKVEIIRHIKERNKETLIGVEVSTTVFPYILRGVNWLALTRLNVQ